MNADLACPSCGRVNNAHERQPGEAPPANGARRCRTCERDRARAARAAQKEAA